jgi:hypothetical protein
MERTRNERFPSGRLTYDYIDWLITLIGSDRVPFIEIFLLEIPLPLVELPVLKHRQWAAAIYEFLDMLNEGLAASFHGLANVFTTIRSIELILRPIMSFCF